MDSDLGSNSWVISGAHTDTGEPINVNDPHLENCMPSEWYLLHFSYPYVSNDSIKTGIFDGGSMPGTPVAIGKTNYMSFSLTVLMGDTQDLYREKVKRNKYLVDGEWRPL